MEREREAREAVVRETKLREQLEQLQQQNDERDRAEVRRGWCCHRAAPRSALHSESLWETVVGGPEWQHLRFLEFILSKQACR